MPRTCSKCNIEESEEHPFKKNWRICITCYRDYQKQKAKEYRDTHPETIKKLSKDYYESHRQQEIERVKQWRTRNPEKPREHTRRQRQKAKKQRQSPQD